MKPRRRSPFRHVAPIAWLALSSPADATERLIRLPDVAGAAWYEGTLTAGGKIFRVRTGSPWILCPEECDVDLRVYDAQGVLLGEARSDPQAEEVTLAPASPAQTTEAADGTATETSRAATPTPSAAPAATAVAPSRTETSAASGPSSEPPASPPGAAAEPRPPAKHESEPAHAAPATPRPRGAPSLVAVSLGLGKESLTARGGVSDYQGSAGIGGTILGALLRPTGGALGAELEVSAHNYSTSTREIDVGTGGIRTRDSKFLRLGARASGFYDFLEGATGGPTLGCGVGLTYLKAPALVITEASSGTADLAEQSAFGPAVTLVAATSAEASHQFGALADYTPVSLSKPWGATHAGATLSWRFAFVPALATVVDVHAASDRLKGRVLCPAVAGCTVETTATSRIVQARVGLGYRF